MTNCPCCGSTQFQYTEVLWNKLIKEWRLSPEEVAYINRQQGYACSICGSNLRSMTLAHAINQTYGFKLLTDFVNKSQMSLLELNEAGHLNPILKNLKQHTLAEYPEVDIMKLPYADNSFDLIVHSDTLEHVKNPVKGLKETYRVLRPGGWTLYTIPVVVGRLSRPPRTASFHGTPGVLEYPVMTEYGADMWTQLFEAGFSNCRMFSLEYPSSIAIGAQKDNPGNEPALPLSRALRRASERLHTLRAEKKK